ncbi:hypothetical protein REPUB_Repub06bG0192800 [Reevesia pubescens]
MNGGKHIAMQCPVKGKNMVATKGVSSKALKPGKASTSLMECKNKKPAGVVIRDPISSTKDKQPSGKVQDSPGVLPQQHPPSMHGKEVELLVTNATSIISTEHVHHEKDIGLTKPSKTEANESVLLMVNSKANTGEVVTSPDAMQLA